MTAEDRDGVSLSEKQLTLRDTTLVWRDGSTEKQFQLGEEPRLIDTSSGEAWEIDASAWRDLRDSAESLRKRHYGELLRWSEVEAKLPRKSVFQVTDLETGLSFRVQRRAGSQHADVQPMTKQDSAVMKQIYGGSWSWKRRAIIVSGGEGEARLAGSMNGMPHGGDGIPDNGFSGHFCIHFLESTTHKVDRPDLAHQLMTHKAAGQIVPYLQRADAETVAAAFLEGVHLRDAALTGLLTRGLEKEGRERIMKRMGTLTTIKLDYDKLMRKPDPEGSMERTVALPALVSRQGGNTRREMFTFTMRRLTEQSPWLPSDVRVAIVEEERDRHEEEAAQDEVGFGG
ncbi:hypothetical protein [Paenibacillus koleovorans]|uniref:hypothetical protein n=1 Tax=Paenibacillus koleovorans TaxID=121608 RepID=UPI000FDBD171|nr:hypothetical protein [Paenibacillus koleovorans]